MTNCDTTRVTSSKLKHILNCFIGYAVLDTSQNRLNGFIQGYALQFVRSNNLFMDGSDFLGRLIFHAYLSFR